jgi:archaeal type IV pilus assembly protein PilA
MNSIRTIKKNAKALSPVVASIILIAVTVAVSVAVAAWMGGMTVGLMGSAEQMAITNIGFDETNNAILVTVQNTGDTAVTIQTTFVNGVTSTASPGPLVPATSPAPTNVFTLTKGTTMTLTVDAGTLVSGTAYQVKIVTAKGNSIAGTATFNTPN